MTATLTLLVGSLGVLRSSSMSASVDQTVIDVEIVISENEYCVATNLFRLFSLSRSLFFCILRRSFVCGYCSPDSNQCVYQFDGR